MPTLNRTGYSIHYELAGPPGAPLLVLANSLGADLSMWDRQAAEFARDFRVLRYDNRGHGQSTAPPAPYSLDDVAGDAVALIGEAGETAAHFCGLSLGGMVGMWLARQRPQLVRKLVLSNTSAYMGSREMWDTRIEAVKKDGMAALARGVMERWFTEGFRTRAAEVVQRVERSFLNVSVEGYTGCATAIRDMDQRQTISTIQAKTMVVAGTFDPSTPPAMGKEIAAAIEGSQYVELPAAHLSNIEAADEYCRVVGEFLRGSR
jgi:3-oxoadipate enol-lactonase